jgi:hypothetical protein
LNYNRYRDNNNFVRHNSLKFTINRWSLAAEEYENEYLDYTVLPNWIGDKFTWPMNSTRDGGLTWLTEDFEMVFGVYFFLSEDKVEQFKFVANIAEVITTMEGVAGLIFMFISIVPHWVNRK